MTRIHCMCFLRILGFLFQYNTGIEILVLIFCFSDTGSVIKTWQMLSIFLKNAVMQSKAFVLLLLGNLFSK